GGLRSADRLPGGGAGAQDRRRALPVLPRGPRRQAGGPAPSQPVSVHAVSAVVGAGGGCIGAVVGIGAVGIGALGRVGAGGGCVGAVVGIGCRTERRCRRRTGQ